MRFKIDTAIILKNQGGKLNATCKTIVNIIKKFFSRSFSENYYDEWKTHLLMQRLENQNVPKGLNALKRNLKQIKGKKK